MKTEPCRDYVWLRLHDEAPRIGSGRRRVAVTKRGYKWITVRYWPGGPNGHHINHRFRKDLFNQLMENAA